MPPFGAWERVKGKRVQIPHDLVTVIREPAARVHLHRSLGFDPGRRRQALNFQPGNLPAAGYGGVPPQITRNWLDVYKRQVHLLPFWRYAPPPPARGSLSLTRKAFLLQP